MAINNLMLIDKDVKILMVIVCIVIVLRQFTFPKLNHSYRHNRLFE